MAAELAGIRWSGGDTMMLRDLLALRAEDAVRVEETYGWNLEMQILVAQRGARILEIPVNHRRRRGGVSKVSGTFSGTIHAAFRIAGTFFRVDFIRNRIFVE
jgi:hypothetical protein